MTTAIETMSKSQKRQARADLRDAISEINDDLASKLIELAELRREIEGLREAKAWRVEALRALRS